MSSAQVKATFTRHRSDDDTWLDIRRHSAKIDFMGKGWNGQNNQVGSRHDLFGLVADFHWFAKLVGAQVVDALDARFGNGGSHAIRFAGKGGKDGNVAVVAAANERRQYVNGVAAATEKNLLVGHDVGWFVEKIVLSLSQFCVFVFFQCSGEGFAFDTSKKGSSLKILLERSPVPEVEVAVSLLVDFRSD